MASYDLQFLPSVKKDLRQIPKGELKKILARMESLCDDPRPPGCTKLSGMDYYRVRQGDCRIVYEIQDGRLIILVIKVRHRRDIYR